VAREAVSWVAGPVAAAAALWGLQGVFPVGEGVVVLQAAVAWHQAAAGGVGAMWAGVGQLCLALPALQALLQQQQPQRFRSPRQAAAAGWTCAGSGVLAVVVTNACL